MLIHLVGDHAVFDKAIHSFQEEQKKEQDKGPDMVNLNFLDSVPGEKKEEEKKEPKVEFY